MIHVSNCKPCSQKPRSKALHKQRNRLDTHVWMHCARLVNATKDGEKAIFSAENVQAVRRPPPAVFSSAPSHSLGLRGWRVPVETWRVARRHRRAAPTRAIYLVVCRSQVPRVYFFAYRYLFVASLCPPLHLVAPPSIFLLFVYPSISILTLQLPTIKMRDSYRRNQNGRYPRKRKKKEIARRYIVEGKRQTLVPYIL